ncbi:uncharacterized protein [Littorina saxatilis]|uniref:CULT domain-containing protein n=1 Tax=Littorina saxatilis TaxID=31220 RepID=A0AAN9B793_9CAEN
MGGLPRNGENEEQDDAPTYVKFKEADQVSIGNNNVTSSSSSLLFEDVHNLNMKLNNLNIHNNYCAGKKTRAIISCRRCDHELCLTCNLTSDHPSDLSQGHRYDNLYKTPNDVLVQWFKNPHDCCFEVVTSTTASVKRTGQAYENYTWFRGYKWTVGSCPCCGQHIGWVYDSVSHPDDTFFGLIVSSTSAA